MHLDSHHCGNRILELFAARGAAQTRRIKQWQAPWREWC
jgi:hypothetical protein